MLRLLQFYVKLLSAIVDAFQAEPEPEQDPPPRTPVEDLSMPELRWMREELKVYVLRCEQVAGDPVNFTEEQRAHAAFCYPSFKEQLEKVQAVLLQRGNFPPNLKKYP
ncbi:hypothetical protein MIND_00741600 [Mycena indigotica]|uniref:Uncharacterized protein n=1 Tax=Mycena indigotica TaxID=2126181 RepID=A0A8H6SL53_9AGAR|nr:uncharacterized protein MIND_00741600 [Mycena indigotica]KAF7301760.1 hypothetical protein MIND_00741600 [Mycena indigotica]